MKKQQYDVLKFLAEDYYCTAKELAEKLLVSEKTIRNRIKELKIALKNYGAKIESKPRYGYRLIILDEDLFVKVQLNQDDNDIPDTNEARQLYLIQTLINDQCYFKMDDLVEKLFISRNILSNNLKRVEEIFQQYQLTVERRPNYGIRLEGSEFNKRNFIVNHLYGDYDVIDQSQILMNLIIGINQESAVNMSEVALDHFIRYCVVMIERIRGKNNIKQNELIENEVSEATQKITNEYCDHIENLMQIIINQTERQYLAIQYGSKLSSDSYSKYGPNFVITGKIDELVFNMLNRVYEMFGINFRNNLELRMSLNQHLVPMDIRLRYNIPVTNPLKEMIKKEYPFPYTLATGASITLKEYYQREIPDDEISYLAVIFALATEKRDLMFEKKNIVLVCVSGKSSAQLFKYKYKQAFGEYINNIFDCNVIDLESFDFEHNQIDYIFTTVPLAKKYPVPIYEINIFIDSSEILTYREMFESGDKSKLLKYYSTNLFIPDLKASTKEEVIQQMCKQINRFGILPEGFYEAVMKREELGQTDFGNLVAIPHPYKTMGQQSFVAVAILEKPILWTTNEAQVIFMLSVGNTDDPDLEDFYKKTSAIFFDSKAIKQLIIEPRFETLIELLA